MRGKGLAETDAVWCGGVELMVDKVTGKNL